MHRFVSLTLLGLTLFAQTKPDSNFQVHVNEVIVPVTVTDEKGRFVSDLDKKDFQIFDEGKEQRIEYFSRERNQPVVIGFLIDLSSASAIHWKTFQDGAVEMVYTLLPGDKKFSGYLLSYTSTPELVVQTTTTRRRSTNKFGKCGPAAARRCTTPCGWPAPGTIW